MEMQAQTAQSQSRNRQILTLEDPEVDGQYKQLIKQMYQSRELSPYHGDHHPQALWEAALPIIDRCKELGIPVDVPTLKRAILLHDVLTHVDPSTLGYESAETLAAAVGYNVARKEGWSSQAAQQVADTILATESIFHPTTSEQKIIRAADLSTVGDRYEVFKQACHNLYHEALIRSGGDTPFDSWLPKAFRHLGHYVAPMVQLTPTAIDDRGCSTWHQTAASNIAALWRETYRQEACVQVEILSNTAKFTMSEREPHVLYFGVHRDDKVRKLALKEAHDVLPLSSTAFALPRLNDALPLPSKCCDRACLVDPRGGDVAEGLRVLRNGGTLQLNISDTSQPMVRSMIDRVPVLSLTLSKPAGGERVIIEYRKV